MKTIKPNVAVKKELGMWDNASCEDYLRFEYALMARDKEREREALGWNEGLLSDI